MPLVNGKEFPYTKKGKVAAKKEAKKSGKMVVMKDSGHKKMMNKKFKHMMS